MQADHYRSCSAYGLLFVVLVAVGIEVAVRLTQGETISEALCCTALATILTLISIGAWGSRRKS